MLVPRRHRTARQAARDGDRVHATLVWGDKHTSGRMREPASIAPGAWSFGAPQPGPCCWMSSARAMETVWRRDAGCVAAGGATTAVHSRHRCYARRQWIRCLDSFYHHAALYDGATRRFRTYQTQPHARALMSGCEPSDETYPYCALVLRGDCCVLHVLAKQ
jgi:hypothetical protein